MITVQLQAFCSVVRTVLSVGAEASAVGSVPGAKSAGYDRVGLGRQTPPGRQLQRDPALTRPRLHG